MLYLSLHGMYNGLINVNDESNRGDHPELRKIAGIGSNSPRSRTNAAVRFDMYGIPARPRPE